MHDPKARTLARQVRQLEDSFCNPRKLKEAEEIRQDLRQQGYSNADIDRMAEGS